MCSDSLFFSLLAWGAELFAAFGTDMDLTALAQIRIFGVLLFSCWSRDWLDGGWLRGPCPFGVGRAGFM